MQADRRWATGAIYDPRNLRLSTLEAALRKIVEKCNSDASHATLATIRMIAEAALGADDRSLNLGAGGQDLSGSTEAPIITAPAPSPDSDGRGQAANVAQSESDQVTLARPSELQRDGEGHHGGAAKAGHAVRVSPSRPQPRGPSPTLVQGILNAARTTPVAPEGTGFVFRLRDGRDIRRVRIRELPAYARTSTIEAQICMRLYQRYANADGNKFVGDLFSPSEVKDYFDVATKELDRVFRERSSA